MNSKALESFLIPINKEIDKIKGIIAKSLDEKQKEDLLKNKIIEEIYQ